VCCDVVVEVEVEEESQISEEEVLGAVAHDED